MLGQFYTGWVRIVSLHPAATDLVHLLGLDDVLVGVSADSDWPPELVRRLPILNTVSIDTRGLTSREIDEAARDPHHGASLYHVDPRRLRAVRPDLILTQEVCEVCAVSRRDVERASLRLGYTPTVLSQNPVILDQVFADVMIVARAAGVLERGRELVRVGRARIDAVRSRTVGLPRPRVFCMEWLDPPYSAGHWVPEMVEAAGGHDELGQPGAYSRPIDWQAILDYEPEVMMLMPCSLSLDQIAAEFPLLAERPGWANLPAVQSRRVYAVDTHLFSRSGPRLIEGIEVLARLLHPDVFSKPLADGNALSISLDRGRLLPFC
ncbi:MAG TPA: ABC transporter substrate-binding protein [Chloroflexota bacterium]